MYFARKIVALVGMSLVIGSMPIGAFAASKHTDAAASSYVRQLLSLMDKDKNGAVSKEEFLQYMSETFDRLDINRSGQLEPAELRNLTVIPTGKHPGGR